MVTPDVFQKFVKMTADNVLDKEQNRRFDYKTLKYALIAVESAEYDSVPPQIMELFRKLVTYLGIDSSLTDREQVLLMLTLINLNMSYVLVDSLQSEDRKQELFTTIESGV